MEHRTGTGTNTPQATNHLVREINGTEPHLIMEDPAQPVGQSPIVYLDNWRGSFKLGVANKTPAGTVTAKNDILLTDKYGDFRFIGKIHIGIGDDKSTDKFHIHNSDEESENMISISSGSYLDGMRLGLSSVGDIDIHNREDAGINLFTRDTLRMSINAAGLVGIKKRLSVGIDQPDGTNNVTFGGPLSSQINVVVGVGDASGIGQNSRLLISHNGNSHNTVIANQYSGVTAGQIDIMASIVRIFGKTHIEDELSTNSLIVDGMEYVQPPTIESNTGLGSNTNEWNLLNSQLWSTPYWSEMNSLPMNTKYIICQITSEPHGIEVGEFNVEVKFKNHSSSYTEYMTPIHFKHTGIIGPGQISYSQGIVIIPISNRTFQYTHKSENCTSFVKMRLIGWG